MKLLNDPLFRAIFNTAVPRIILKANVPHFTIVDYNEAYKTATNTHNRDVKGMDLFDAFIPEEGGDGGKILLEALQNAVSSNKTVNMPPFNYDIPSAADPSKTEVSWWQLEIVPVAGEDGALEYLLTTTRNITDQIFSKSKAEESRQREHSLNQRLNITNEQLAAANEELNATIEELGDSQNILRELNNSLESRIAERTRQLSDSEHQLRSIIMTTPIGMTVLRTTELIVETANQQMLDIWNRNLDQVLGNRMIDIFPELDGQPFPDMLRSVIETGKPVVVNEMPAIISTTSGLLKNYYVNFSYDPLFDTDGQVTSLLATVIDVTATVEARKLLERSEAEQQALNEELAATNEELEAINEDYAATNEELKESQINLNKALADIQHGAQRLDEILSQLPIPVVVLTGPDQVIEQSNAALHAFWKKSPEQITGKPILSVLPELKDQPYPAQWKHVLETGEMISHREKPVLYKNDDGTDRHTYVDYYYKALYDIDGNRVSVLVTVNDVTDKVLSRRRIEESEAEQQALNEELAATNNELASINEEYATINEELIVTNEELSEAQDTLKITLADLANSESRLKYMLSEAPVAIALMTGRDLIVESANKMVLKIWGKTTDIIGKPLHLALPELQGQPFLQVLDEIFISGEPFYGNEAKAMIEVNGVLQEVYSNFVYYPLKNDWGETTSIMLVAHVVTEQVLARRELQKAEEILRFSVEAANIGTWFLNRETREFVISPKLKELFGFNADDEVSFDDVSNQIPEDYRHRVHDAINIAIETGGTYTMEHPAIGFHDQKLRWIRALGRLTENENGELAHFSGVLMDITEQKQDEIRKNDFIGMVSHELKTPLTTITAIVQLLSSKAKKAEDTFTAGALDRANNQVKKMSAMVNGFLNISRLESGKLLIEKQRFELNGLIKDIIEETALTVPNHHFNFPPCEPTLVLADRDKIGSVISNLLTNAVKYSNKNTTITINCHIQQNNAIVSIADQGIGIAEQDAKKLFERYYRVKDSHHISGFGIGLYLSAEIVKGHGGRIWLDSQEGVGSTFYFSIPLN